MKKTFLITSIILGGCSLTYSPVEQLAENEYKITTYGNAFSSREDLKMALNEKAQEVCGSDKYEFIPNFMGDEISIQNSTAYGVGPGYSDVTTGTAFAKIRCLKESGND